MGIDIIDIIDIVFTNILFGNNTWNDIDCL